MKRWMILSVAALTTLFLVSAAFALTKPQMEPVSREYAELEQAKPVRQSILTGTVTGVNQAAKTLTVNKVGWLRRGEVTFVVEPHAAPYLADLKRGDWVDVTYAEAGGKLIAQVIVRRMAEGEQ